MSKITRFSYFVSKSLKFDVLDVKFEAFRVMYDVVHLKFDLV